MSGCGQIQIDKLLEESAARADELAGRRSSKVSSKRRDAWSPWLASIAGHNECAPQRRRPVRCRGFDGRREVAALAADVQPRQRLRVSGWD